MVATASGDGQFTTVDLDRRPVRYVRITLTTAAPNNWWSVADVRAYTSARPLTSHRNIALGQYARPVLAQPG